MSERVASKNRDLAACQTQSVHAPPGGIRVALTSIESMSFMLTISLLCAGLGAGTLAAFELGRRLRLRRPDKGPSGTGVIETSMLGLLGLLIGFTFSGAASRFEARQRLIIDETNAIGTAYLRLDLLPAGAQPALRACFGRYLDARLDAYRKLPDLDAARTELARSKEIEAEIWRRAVDASRDAPPSVAMLLLNALNPMFDIATTRTLNSSIHPPTTIFVMLGALVLISACFAGYSAAEGERRWMHMVGFALTISIAVYVILDLEYPRMGLIQVDRFDRALVELRQTMP